jgi:hypothetical protein
MGAKLKNRLKQRVWSLSDQWPVGVQYNGLTIRAIIDTDPSHMSWMISMLPKFRLDEEAQQYYEQALIRYVTTGK